MPNDSYKTFRVSVRPERVACFIDINEQNWQAGALTIIESFSRTWGGAHFIIVPTDGHTISDAFWRILSSYDPDYLWIYSGGQDDPYEPSFELSGDLQQTLKLRLAPFHLQEHVIQGGAYPNFEPRFPNTDLITIIPNCEHPNDIVEISGLGGSMELLAASVTGRAATAYKEALQAVNIGNRTVDYSNNLPELFDLVSRNIRGGLRVDDSGFPFAFSLTQLGFYRSVKFPNWLEATLVVVGETPEDFCLYYCLSRLCGKVMWLLPSWLPSQGADDYAVWSDQTHIGCFARSLRNLAEGPGQRSRIHLLSLSHSSDELGGVRSTLARSWRRLPIDEGLPLGDGALPTVAPSLSTSLEWLLRHPFRLYEIGNVSKTTSRHFFGEDMAGTFETPKPKRFSYVPPYDHRWITEISAVDHQLPRHPLLGDHVVLHPTSSALSARTGKGHIAYFCPNTAHFGGDLDETLVRPAISLPNFFTIFRRLLQDVNYDYQISDKGRFTIDTLGKFGGISPLAHFLLTNRKRAVLEKYLDHKKSGPDVKDEGLFLQSDRRRYLDFPAVVKIMGNDKAAADLIDTLISQSVLHRGLVLKCEFCRSTDWFGIAELTNEFRCKRCSRAQVYRQFHALSRPEPSWFYKLDEIVFKALGNDMLVPVLTLHQLKKGAASFLYSPDIEVLDSASKEQLFELDICCIPEGELTIGEAKKNNRLGKTAREEWAEINKYFDLAQKIGVTQVVFATYSERWRDETERMIRERFSDSLVKVLLWTRNDLSKLY